MKGSIKCKQVPYPWHDSLTLKNAIAFVWWNILVRARKNPSSGSRYFNDGICMQFGEISVEFAFAASKISVFY